MNFMPKLATLAVLSALSGAALSAPGPYVAGSLGLSLPVDAELSAPGTERADFSLDGGLGLSAGLGYQLANGLRFEAGLAYQKNDLDKAKDVTGEAKMNGDVSSTAFLASAYYDIPTGTKISPFIGGGVGLAKVRLNDVALEGDRDMLNTNDMVFAYHLSLGVSFAVNPQLNLDAGYRYAATEDLRFSSGDSWNKEIELTNAAHNLFAGVRYAF